MNAPTELSRMITSLEDRVSADEWQTRVDLAAAYRLVAMFRWDDLVFTHITAKIPGTEHYLINPYGLMFDEITASSLVKIDLDGKVLQDTPFPINPAGFVIHSAVHAARHDIQCVMHTHTINGVAVSAQKSGLLPISQFSIFVLASLGYHDYEGVALRDERRSRAWSTTSATTPTSCCATTAFSPSARRSRRHSRRCTCSRPAAPCRCGHRLPARWPDGALIGIHPEIVATSMEQARVATLGAGPGALIWPGLLRRLDRADDSWRH